MKDVRVHAVNMKPFWGKGKYILYYILGWVLGIYIPESEGVIVTYAILQWLRMIDLVIDKSLCGLSKYILCGSLNKNLLCITVIMWVLVLYEF